MGTGAGSTGGPGCRPAASYRGIDVPGQPYVLGGRVTGKRTEDGHGLVDLEICGENRDGVRTTLGSAVVDVALRR